MKHSVFATFFLYLRLPYVLYSTLFWKKIILNEIFQVGPCPNLKDSSLYERFPFICTRHEAFGISYFFALSATPLCLVRYMCLEKDEIFQVDACPNLTDSSLYDRFIIHTHKA